MHRTPNVPGTGPLTDDPNPGGAQGMDTQGPGTDAEGGAPGGEGKMAGSNPAADRPGPEGGGNLRTFRCADVGNSDCRWEVSGRTEDELRPQIERHGREAHGI